MPTRTYLSLPIRPEEGFPQAFRLSFGGQIYEIVLYVNVAEEILPSLPDPFDLPVDRAFMVMRVSREMLDGPHVIFQRKVICNLEYEAAELAFLFTTLRVAKANLNGVGYFGSQVDGGVANR